MYAYKWKHSLRMSCCTCPLWARFLPKIKPLKPRIFINKHYIANISKIIYLSVIPFPVELPCVLYFLSNLALSVRARSSPQQHIPHQGQFQMT